MIWKIPSKFTWAVGRTNYEKVTDFMPAISDQAWAISSPFPAADEAGTNSTTFTEPFLPIVHGTLVHLEGIF